MKSHAKIFQLQLALIDLRFDNEPLEEYMAVKSMVGRPIKTTPIVMPFANNQNLPGEIPIVQAGDPATGYGINVGRSRLDFIVNFEKGNSIDVFYKDSESIIRRYERGGIGRLGVIAQYFVDQQNPTRWIKDTFLKRASDDVEEVLIRYNRKEIVQNIAINNLIQIQEVRVITNGEEKKTVHVQVDINTPVSSRRLTSEMSLNVLNAKNHLIKSKTIGEII